MKILHVLHQFPDQPAGGTERTVAALAIAMRDAGHEVGIVRGSLDAAPSQRIDRGEVAGFPVHTLHRQDLHFESWEKAWSPLVGDAFRRLLREERPDIVHVHHWIRLTSDLVRIARQQEVPVVACTLHDYWSRLADPVRPLGSDVPEPPTGPAWLSATERAQAFAAHRADLADEIRAAHLRFAPSRAHAAGLAEFSDGPLGAIHTSTPPIHELPPRRDPVEGPRGKRLLFWGSLYAAKGIDTVLDALFSIQSGWELHVVGEASDRDYGEVLRARSAHMPVTFHGRLPLAAMATLPVDYIVLPSLCHESYGLVLDEARAVGLPALAADQPAYREHADEAATAWFEPNDPGSLAMLLLDEAGLQGLAAPLPPQLVTPEAAAAELLARYGEARDGVHGPLAHPPEMPPWKRARILWARAERRLWSALQHDAVTPPPGDWP